MTKKEFLEKIKSVPEDSDIVVQCEQLRSNTHEIEVELHSGPDEILIIPLT